jgi:hypothetical protein
MNGVEETNKARKVTKVSARESFLDSRWNQCIMANGLIYEHRTQSR